MLKNSTHGFGLIEIILHWFSAGLTGGLLGIGLWMRNLDYYHPWYQQAPKLHVSLGLVLIVALILSICWRFFNPAPQSLSIRIHEILTAKLIHILLLILLILLTGSGYLYSTANGQPAEFFNSPVLPPLKNSRLVSEHIGVVHELLAYALIAGVALHASAALKHHFIDRDKTLLRIIFPIRRSSQFKPQIKNGEKN